jgi:hypothetical protein
MHSSHLAYKRASLRTLWWMQLLETSCCGIIVQEMLSTYLT